MAAATAVVIIGLGCLQPLAARSYQKRSDSSWLDATPAQTVTRPPVVLVKNGGWGVKNSDSMTPEEKARILRQYKEWQSLPPEQQDAMRRRYNDYNRMAPRERERYQQRYRQWQRLSPEEQRQLEKNLQRWDNLSPQERDTIRRRFN
jgi:hypothetical protein